MSKCDKSWQSDLCCTAFYSHDNDLRENLFLGHRNAVIYTKKGKNVCQFFLHKSYFHTAGRIIVSMELIDNHSRSGLCFSPLNNFFFVKRRKVKFNGTKEWRACKKITPFCELVKPVRPWIEPLNYLSKGRGVQQCAISDRSGVMNVMLSRQPNALTLKQ